MNEIVAARTPEQIAGLKNVTQLVYGLQALSFLFGFTAIVGVVINYVKRDDARGTLLENHFDWQIRTFWWGVLWVVVGTALALIVVGFAVLFVAWVWMIYRVAKGWLKLNENKPVLPEKVWT
jgi:uncharacterized membrane protein